MTSGTFAASGDGKMRPMSGACAEPAETSPGGFWDPFRDAFSPSPTEATHGRCEQNDDGSRQEPVPVVPVMSGDPGGGESHHYPECQRPVIADHKVIREAAESALGRSRQRLGAGHLCVLTSKGTGKKDTCASDEDDEDGKGAFAARPSDPCSFSRPEHAKRRQEDSDNELQRVLRHAAQRSMDEDSRHYHRHCGERRRQRTEGEPMLGGPERQNDENDLRGPRERHP